MKDKFSHINLALFISLTLILSTSNSIASDWTEVRTLEGKFTTLSQHFEEDKWTLVMLWTTDCGICQREYPMISEFHDKHKDKNAKVIGVSLDGYSKLEKITKHIDEMPMTFDNLIGEITVVAFNYQNATEEPLRGTPTFLMFNPNGQLVGHNPGPVKPEALEQFINRK
ncbi:MAG: TlpA disulfide reductase family protein [Pseudomonadota bacterium]